MKRKLNSQGGCLRCRARRKKCDERRPICMNCERGQLGCVWVGNNPIVKHLLPANKVLGEIYASLTVRKDHIRTHDNNDATSSMLGLSVVTANAMPPLRNETECRLYQALQSMLRTAPVLDFGDVLHFSSFLQVPEMMIESPWVRSAGFSFMALIMSEHEPSLRIDALCHYSEALDHLKQHIKIQDKRFTESERKENLIATFFMGLKEYHDPENTIYPLPHFEMLGSLLHQYGIETRAKPAEVSKSFLSFHQAMVEVYVYHVAMVAFLYPSEHLALSLSPEVDVAIKASTNDPEQYAFDCTRLRLWRVLFETMKLSEVVDQEADPQRRVKYLENELKEIDKGNLGRISDDLHDHSDLRRHAWITAASAALRILILRFEDRSVLSSSEQVRTLVAQGLEPFKACDFNDSWTTNLCWMNIIFLCAAYTTHEFAILRKLLEKIRPGLFPIDTSRTRKVLATLLARRNLQTPPNHEGLLLVQPDEHDTLVLLVRKVGILGKITSQA